jgi:hypothetical protein
MQNPVQVEVGEGQNNNTPHNNTTGKYDSIFSKALGFYFL